MDHRDPKGGKFSGVTVINIHALSIIKIIGLNVKLIFMTISKIMMNVGVNSRWVPIIHDYFFKRQFGKIDAGEIDAGRCVRLGRSG